jgi:two-component system OmpR family sensor kinase
MSLRSRLVLVVLVVLGVGLIASDVATVTMLRSYLLDRVDERLDATIAISRQLFADGFQPGAGPGNSPRRAQPPGASGVPDIQAARIGGDGRVVGTVQGPFSQPSPVFAQLPAGPLDRARTGRTVRFAISAQGGAYRAVAELIPGSTDLVVVITAVHDVDATMSRVLRIEGIGTAVLVLLAGAAALWLVRVGLRPLRHMADTADAVAAGEGDRRVDVSGGNEVARLGHALNSAFDAQNASKVTLQQFIADASHELRTPLTSIRGYAELFRAGALTTSEDAARAADRIEREAARMGLLVDDLLALARLDENRPLTLIDVDLTSLASDAVSDARAVEPERPITLRARDATHVLGDEAALRQVFANLLANVREHTAAGTAVEVRVTGESSEARIDVIDYGDGMDPEERVHAFDRFWRSGRAHSRSAGGSGLGLAIVAAVARAHGGRAYVEDNGARGAHIVVQFPARPRA